MIERVNPSLPIVCFSNEAIRKLRLYVTLCPFEISGLGEVEPLPHGFLVQDLFLLKQKCYHSYTELLPEDMARFLISMVTCGRDPARLKLWWHSHSRMDVFWSPIDDYTAKGFQNDYMVSLVTNVAGDYLCRLDLYQPLKLTVDKLPVMLPARSDAEEPDIRDAIFKEISDQVIFYSDPSDER